MQTKNIKYISFLLIISINISCYNIIEVETTDIAKTITVNSFLSPDTNFMVNLSYSKTIYDANDYFIKNANVILSREDTSVVLEYMNNGIYTTDIKPVVNEKYKLKIIKNDTVITAETYIPDTNFVLDISVKLQTGYCSAEQSEYADLNLTIKDNQQQNNYYEIFIPDQIKWDTSEYIYIQTDNNIKFFQIDDSILTAENYFPSSVINTILICDKNFKNEIVTLHLHPLVGASKFTTSDSLYLTSEFILCVRNVSEEYYKYFKSYELYLNNVNHGSGFNSFVDMSFIEKNVNVYQNINNGYGIFAGYSEYYRKLFIKEVSPIN